MVVRGAVFDSNIGEATGKKLVELKNYK